MYFSLSLSFPDTFCSFVYTTSSVRFLPKYLGIVLFAVIAVKRGCFFFFLILCYNCFSQVFINVIVSYMFPLYLATLLNSFISCNNLFVSSFRFSACIIMLPTNNESFVFFFPFLH